MTKGSKNWDCWAKIGAQKYRDDNKILVKFYLPHIGHVAKSLWAWQRQQLPELSRANLKNLVQAVISVKSFRNASRIQDNVNPEDLMGDNPTQVSEAVHITLKHFQSVCRRHEKKKKQYMITVGDVLRNIRRKYFSITAIPC